MGTKSFIFLLFRILWSKYDIISVFHPPQGGVHLSLISPRCLADLRHLVQKTLPIPSSETDTSPLDDIDHALHPGHLVLLQGFQLSGNYMKNMSSLFVSYYEIIFCSYQGAEKGSSGRENGLF